MSCAIVHQYLFQNLIGRQQIKASEIRWTKFKSFSQLRTKIKGVPAPATNSAHQFSTFPLVHEFAPVRNTEEILCLPIPYLYTKYFYSIQKTARTDDFASGGIPAHRGKKFPSPDEAPRTLSEPLYWFTLTLVQFLQLLIQSQWADILIRSTIRRTVLRIRFTRVRAIYSLRGVREHATSPMTS